MLLQHAWLAPLAKPDTISEEDEEDEAAHHLQSNGGVVEDEAGEGTQWIDKDVGEWVREQLRKKKAGTLGNSRKPALHAAPLDAVPSPVRGTGVNAGAVAV